MAISRRVFLTNAALSTTACGPRYGRLLAPAKFTKPGPAVYRTRFNTTQGEFVIEVHREWAPLGADRFYNLVRGGYYDGQRFFRTLQKFVVQWGISPNPAISKAWGEGTRIKDDPVKQSNTRGYVTFATSGPNTRTASIFVNMADNSRLDKERKIREQGEAYLAKEFPSLDRIVRSRIVR